MEEQKMCERENVKDKRRKYCYLQLIKSFNVIPAALE
jgi:hypothetical protein